MLGFWVSLQHPLGVTMVTNGSQINYACDQTISSSLQAQWIVPLGLQLVPGVLLCAGMLVCPESPRWLARKDRWEEAEKVLLHLRNLPSDHPYIHDELSDIRQQVEQHTANKMLYRKMFKRLIQKGVRNRVLTGLLLMACQNMTGVNIITYCKLLLAVRYASHWLTGS